MSEEVTSKPMWFALHTLSGQEMKVRDSILKRLKAEEMQNYIQEVLVPMEKVVEVRNQKKTVSQRKLHPGYVYINISFLDLSSADNNHRIITYIIKDLPEPVGESSIALFLCIPVHTASNW